MSDLAAYAGLFLSAFVAATLLPMQSEAVLIGLLMMETHPAWALVAAASAGNILGSAVNWGLGRACMHLDARPWFPVGAEKIERARAWYRRYGKWSLLMSWMPVIGDPLTLVAGILREPFPTFLALVAIAKTLRYIVLAATAVNLG
ncbi:MAG: DedA family protein [Alphaproteobacteria bacterium]|jgi:membrane protein YqaA with SNARE-associated domain|nr:DedA family protein [Alphaproteobacteria bacterium]MDX5415890.1 DedA family protein [Alphaproteobacteria bacterium]MDX5493183.1 DedA family protein [Alphaproteobacteria bacterium]